MWWNPRLYALALCVSLLARWSYRVSLKQLDGEYDTWAALIAFWIPLFGVIYIAGSFLLPIALRRWRRLRR